MVFERVSTCYKCPFIYAGSLACRYTLRIDSLKPVNNIETRPYGVELDAARVHYDKVAKQFKLALLEATPHRRCQTKVALVLQCFLS